MELEGKVAIVTGATRGIGRATAPLFAKVGAAVVLAGRNEQQGREVVAEIEDAGGRAMFVVTDVADSGQVASLVNSASGTYGGVDVLVNNAGIEFGKPLLETSELEWDRLMAVNLKGHFVCAVAVVPEMVKRGRGAIVNTASVLAIRVMRGTGAYMASKAAILGLTRAMALEWTPLGIRTNCVLPGSTDTDMMWNGIAPDQIASRRRAEDETLPIGRVAEPSEIAQASLWPASDRASFASGTLLLVDGGALSEHPAPRWKPTSA